MGRTSGAQFGSLTKSAPYRRTVAAIQGKVTKLGERNTVSRISHARDDKEKIAAWRSGLGRILQIFNVRSAPHPLASLTI